MESTSVSTAETIPAREVWKEEPDFTEWLVDNISILEERLEMELSVHQEEKKLRDGYKADIIAKNEEENSVVIENQFGKSDHQHLGELLMYINLSGAKVGIWICEEPCSEHIDIISWLNDSIGDVSLYLVKLAVLKIDDSNPAPRFTILAGPRAKVKEITDKEFLREKFWEQLLRRSKKKTKLFAKISSSRGSWISTGAGISGVTYTYVILENEARVKFDIDTKDKAKNKRYFDRLREKKSDIENNFGGKLKWDYKKGRRLCNIAFKITGGLSNKKSWDPFKIE